MGQGKRLAYYVEKQGFTKKNFCEINSLEYNSMVMIMAEKRVIGINVLNRIHEIPFNSNYSDEHTNRALKDICKICGIKKRVTYHVSRHTFATNFIISGGNVTVLQKLLGHSKIEDTMIYVHIAESVTDIEILNLDTILNN